MNKKVCLYMRVANAEQSAKDPFRKQEEALKKYCEEKGYQIVGIKRSICSGLDTKESLSDFIKAAARLNAKAILAYDWARVSRSVDTLIKCWKKAERHDTHLSVIKEHKEDGTK